MAMKERIRVSLVQFVPEWLQPEKNAERMANIAQEEAENGSELILFPELSNLGYITPALPGLKASFEPGVSAQEFADKYVKASEEIPGPTTERLTQVTQKYGVYIVVGISRLHPVIPATIFCSAALIGPSGVIGVYDKVHIAANEKLFFYPGDSIEVYKTDLGNIGMMICYDGRFPELARILSLKGAEIICWIINIVYMEKFLEPHTVRFRSYVRAIENSNYCLGCSRGGREGEISFVGHSAIAAPNGEIIAYSDSEEEDVITAELRNEEIVKVRSSLLTIFADRRPELYSAITDPLSSPRYAHANQVPAKEEEDRE
jgi:predicted amidohydrolase